MNSVMEEREARPSSQASPIEKHREPAPQAARMQKDPASGKVSVAQSPVDGHASCLDLAAEFIARG
ncbi:MAG TPA: hypothetical protein VJ723_04100 [Candidatus Angelobacter sp.]|nr:hypothetical protein [Candidatus Angelobacter sp.]